VPITLGKPIYQPVHPVIETEYPEHSDHQGRGHDDGTIGVLVE
jgi:hypothetical protein